jgi:hypothetical protein
MFEQLREKYQEHADRLEASYIKSNELGLSPSYLPYKEFDKSILENLYQIVDMANPLLNYDHVPGACLYAHSELKKAFALYGYHSELVFGDVLVNGVPYMDCDIADLESQLSEGITNKAQKVHCWLLLDSGLFFDATLIRDVIGGEHAGESIGFGFSLYDEGIVFEHKAMLVGEEFIRRTNPLVYK